MRHDTKPPFDQADTPSGVCVADGWGIKVHVKKGHLIVEDGIGRSRRTRRYHKATSGLIRLVILGHSGFLTFEATRWLSDAKISVIHIDTDGTVLTAAGRSPDNPALRRAQALAATNQTGIEVSRHLLFLKIEGQRRVADRLDGDLTEVDQALDAIENAESLDDMRRIEMQAAVVYWQTWAKVEMQFVRADQKRVPEHWRTIGQRRSPQSASARRAVNPPNAILNYLYALLEAEASLALRAVGLDPGLGIVHLDTYARDSFSLDLMEAVRPDVDAYLLDLIEGHMFRASDFHETRSGGCRISRPLAHILSETATMWRNHLAEPAEAVTRLLAADPDANIKHLTTPLTQANRRQAKASSWTGSPATVKLGKNCEQCGVALIQGGKLCASCWGQFQDNAEWVAVGRAKLVQLRQEGVDPAHGGEAARKRGQSNRQHQNAVAEWNARNDRPDSGVFQTEILPAIQDISLNQIAAATGLSVDYCSKIRRGLRVPHPRHWAAFRAVSHANASKLT